MENKLPVPVFVRPYPPFALALGTSFLTWLSGSLAWDSLFRDPRDLTLAVLFIVAFVMALATALYAWVSILAIRRIGLTLDQRGIRLLRATPVGLHARFLAWDSLEGIELTPAGVLRFSARGEELDVPTAGLLENPEWILERAQEWRAAVSGAGRSAKTTEPPLPDETVMDGLTCGACGSSIPLTALTREPITCPVCGARVHGRPGIRQDLDRVIRLIRDLPAAHRRLHRDLLKIFVIRRRKYDRTLRAVAASTAALWLLFAAVEWLSAILRPDSPGVNGPFILACLGLAALALGGGFILAACGRRITRRITPAFHALPSPEAGGPARCRFCGAGLPGKEIIRHCDYCGSDSIVVGEELTVAERSAREALQLARQTSGESMESGLRLLNNAFAKLQALTNWQVFWLHIPVLVALDGYPGMLYRLTGLSLTMLAGTLLATFLGIRWLHGPGFESNPGRQPGRD